ncbi:stonustoxin subunit beta-like isoform X1 [Pimephales promelas]|uniref:stonustoxin subunit beta-like isoform X1 n=1 Tax=Pimephales promelas TaxID=90988 RepID=UPI001955890B|nr:stonustoxin subunit beta-like isoform X1 [Pimephales promelas]XP_039509747.1 stonustoxin subunit beta-like isoform X1 [Pimephales promelas]XP_039509748.1 stonustoxin subunit beta-like isoform X1 [Pimephales promelas]
MATVGVNVIETAALGRPFQLGMLYDCRKDALIPGITLWDQEKLQQSLRVRPQINTNFKVTASDSIKDKSSLLNIDGSLKLSVLGGLVNVTGAAKYLNDTKKSFKQQRLSLHYHSTSRFEELSMNHLAPENIVHHEVFDNDAATHVVTAVLYGADACFVFDREVSSDEEIKTVEGEAKVAFEKLKLISVGVNSNLKMNDAQKNAVQKFTCTFYGDFQLPSNPTSFEDALKVFADLPNLLGEKKELAVPLRVWLFPLDKLLSKASKLQKDISMNLIIKTESVIGNLNTTEMKCNDLLEDSPSSNFAAFHDKILQMKQNCDMYKLRLMEKLGSLLPNIRGDVKKETDLNDLLQEHDGSPFRGRDLAEWLKERERESNNIKSVLRQLKNAGAQVEDNIDLISMDLEVGNLFCYTFTSLDWSDVLLDKQTIYLNPSTNVETDENSPDPEQKSWLTPEIQKTLRSNLKIFKNLIDSKERKPAKFIVSSKEMKNNPGSCILLYESECDEAVCFIPPSKPACPITEEVKDDSVVLKVPPSCPETVELRILYKRRQDSFWSSKPVPKDENTVTLTDLREETEYEIRCAVLGKLDYTVYSDVTEVVTEERGSLIVDPCGLINQGMTGYLNAVLQTLFRTDRFREHVLILRNEVTSKSSGENLLKALADLFRRLLQDPTAVCPEEVTKALNITNVSEQQDAAEYLQMILHRVPEPSEIFRGVMVTSTVCSYCKHNNEEETDFLSIPLLIDARGHCDVKYALMEYLGIHDMSGDDQLYCVACDSMRDMETRNDIQKWPDILTLQLKRFEMGFIGNKLYYWKNECYVKIPPNLQVDSVMDESSPQYDLYAVINHHGSYISGHYDAVIKDERGNFYRFNDRTVTKIAKEAQWIDACSNSAYLLMYRKVQRSAHRVPQNQSRLLRCSNRDGERV